MGCKNGNNYYTEIDFNELSDTPIEIIRDDILKKFNHSDLEFRKQINAIEVECWINMIGNVKLSSSKLKEYNQGFNEERQGFFYPFNDHWVCIEYRFKMNSLNYDSSSNSSNERNSFYLVDLKHELVYVEKVGSKCDEECTNYILKNCKIVMSQLKK